jgi:hypothetical protein
MASVTFYAFDSSEPDKSIAIEGVTVFVFTEDGSTFLDSGETGEDGEVVFELPDETYWVRFFKAGFSFGKRVSVEVSGDGIYDVAGLNLDQQPPATLSNLCRVSGYLVGAAGQYLPDVTIELMLTDYVRITAGMATGNAKVIVVSDGSGYVEFDLIRKARYDAVVESYGDQVFSFAVPDLPATGFTRLIWPYVARVDLSTPSISLSVGEDAEVEFSSVLSSGWVGKYPKNPDGEVSDVVSAKSSDVAVAQVTQKDGVLTVLAVGPGTCDINFIATLEAARRAPESLPSLVPLTVEVNE